MVVETITVITKFKDLITGKITKVNKQVQTLSDTMQKTTTISSKMTKKGLTPISKVTKTAKGNFRRFRMEMLSVMFGAQMVSKALWGLLKPALTLVGAFELFSLMLQMLFLPIALWLLENFFLPLFNAFTSLPEPIKQAIGAFVLLAGIFFSILAIGASLVLFFGGLTMAWPLFTAAVTTAIATITPLIAGLGIIFGAVLLIIIGFVLAWKTNFGNIKGWMGVFWEGIKTTFSGFIDIIKGFWKIFIGLFSGNSDMIIEGVKLLIEGIKKMWTGLKAALISLTIMIGLSILRIFAGIVTSIWGLLKGLGTSALNKVKGVLGGRQMGGYVPHTGLYKLHAGETVSQAGSTFNSNIIVNASSNVDIEMLKTQLSSQWNDELSRLSRR